MSGGRSAALPLIAPQQAAPVPAIPFGDCPAKTTASGQLGLSVMEHSRLTALVARQLCRVGRWSMPAGVDFLAAAHDVGKVSPEFQLKYFSAWVAGRCPGLAPYAYYSGPHNVVSQAAYERWAATAHPGKAAASWAEVIGAHHGLRALPKLEGDPSYGGPNWAVQRQQMLDQLEVEFGPPPTFEAPPEKLKEVSGLVTVADWLASNEDFSGWATGLSEAAVETYLLESGWARPAVIPGLSFQDLFGDATVQAPHPMQREFHATVTKPGVYILEGPTGHGKTEAALWVAYQLMEAGHHHGLYFALPTRMTSDSIHERAGRFIRRAFGEGAGARLVHGQAWLKDFNGGGEELRPGGSWFAPSKRSILYPFGVGTVDQALMAVLPVRHAWVRWFALAGKVVILDEVHSYDAYTGALLEDLIRGLRALGCTVLILSATLTEGRRRRLLMAGGADAAQFGKPVGQAAAYPLVSGHAGGNPLSVPVAPAASRRVKLGWTTASPAVVAETVAGRVRGGQTVLWIANSVADAVARYQVLRAKDGGLRLGLLHAKFPPWRRNQIEAEWLVLLGKGARQEPAVLVSTQIAEQSLDVDADFLVTSLAPTDLLIQRLGRLWRHNRPRPCAEPEVLLTCSNCTGINNKVLFRDTLGDTAKVYDRYLLWRTLQVLDGRVSLDLPAEVRELLEKTHAPASKGEPRWVRQLRRKRESTSRKLIADARGLTQLALPAGKDTEGDAPTRVSDVALTPTLLAVRVVGTETRADVTLLDGQTVVADAAAEPRDFMALKALHRNLVQLPTYEVMSAPAPEWLRSHVYGARLLLVRSDGRLTLNGQSTDYRYTDELGVHRWSTRKPKLRGMTR